MTADLCALLRRRSLRPPCCRACGEERCRCYREELLEGRQAQLEAWLQADTAAAFAAARARRKAGL